MDLIDRRKTVIKSYIRTPPNRDDAASLFDYYAVENVEAMTRADLTIFLKDILSAQNLPQVVPIVTSQSVITEITKGTGDKSFTKKEFISFAKKNKHLLTRLTEEVKKSFIVPMESFSKSALLVTLILSDTWKVSVSHEKQMYKKLDPSVVDNIILQSIIKPSFEDKYQLFHFGNSEHGHYDVLLLFAKSTLMDSSKSALLKTSDIMVHNYRHEQLPRTKIQKMPLEAVANRIKRDFKRLHLSSKIFGHDPKLTKDNSISEFKIKE